jgi:hypothetical protein
MKQRGSVRVSNASPEPVRVVVEPWAIEYDLPSRSFCEVISVGGYPPIDIEVENLDYGIVFWINTEGATYEYWQDGRFID